MLNKVILLILFSQVIQAARPVWTFTPLTSTHVTVPSNGITTVLYQIKNQSKKTKTLSLQPMPGIIQDISGENCGHSFVLSHNDSCTLELKIIGSEFQGSITKTPVICSKQNICYRPSIDNLMYITIGPETNTTLVLNRPSLALSRTGYTEYGIGNNQASGLARSITLTNNGNADAENLSLSQISFSPGTVYSHNCPQTLPAGNSCTITITPGNIASYANDDYPCDHGSTPKPSIITISANNAPSVNAKYYILGYSCYYQGGYVFAFDDSSPSTVSVGGKVMSTTDQSTSNGIIWSSNGSSGQSSGGQDRLDTSYDRIPGIDINSTPQFSSPSFQAFTNYFSAVYTNPNPFSANDFDSCQGADNGQCNSQNILKFYNRLITNYTVLFPGPYTASPGPTPLNNYAAGLCAQSIKGYNDWYLPAICELGYGTNCGTLNSPKLQNIQSSFVDSSLLQLSGYYWSSTADVNDQFLAWTQYFGSSPYQPQSPFNSANLQGVRCVRTLTP